jgi:hypothetical protein
MKTRFKSEKHAREETIGRAMAMAAAAVRENRAFNQREQRKVELLLANAEALGLGKNIPRDATGLATYAAKPSGGRRRGAEITAANVNAKS